MSTTECVNSYLHAYCVHESSHIAIYLAIECVLGRIDAFCGQPIALRSNYCHARLRSASFLRHARLRPGISSAFIWRFAALWVFVPGAEKCAWPKNSPAPLRFAADFGRDRMETRSIVLSRQEKRPNCRKHGHDRSKWLTTILSRQIIAAQRALPTAAYLTRSLRPTRRMVVVVMPLS